MQPGLLDVLRGQPIKLIHSVSDTEFHEYYYATFGTGKKSYKPKIASGKHLVIWLMTNLFHYRDLANVFFGLLYFIKAIFGPKIANKIALMKFAVIKFA